MECSRPPISIWAESLFLWYIVISLRLAAHLLSRGNPDPEYFKKYIFPQNVSPNCTCLNWILAWRSHPRRNVGYTLGCPKKLFFCNFFGPELPNGVLFRDTTLDYIWRAQIRTQITVFGRIWAHIWACQIWSSGVSLKRSCKMQFRRVGLRSIGPSSQKLWPNQIFGWFPHCNYNVNFICVALRHLWVYKFEEKKSWSLVLLKGTRMQKI